MFNEDWINGPEKVATPEEARKVAEIFMPFGFPGYDISSVDHTTQVFSHELADFCALMPGLKEFLESYGGYCAKLKRGSGLGVQAFSSAAYPECPDVIFYTELIRFHLPPSTVWEPSRAWRNYPVLENLVHESIHHWWGDEMYNHAMLCHELENEIQVSWRKEVWTVDKAMHAGMVYLAAYELRWMFAPELTDEAGDKALEIFRKVPAGEWTRWAKATFDQPWESPFLKRLGVK